MGITQFDKVLGCNCTRFQRDKMMEVLIKVYRSDWRLPALTDDETLLVEHMVKLGLLTNTGEWPKLTDEGYNITSFELFRREF